MIHEQVINCTSDIEFAKNRLEEFQPRDEYKELLEHRISWRNSQKWNSFLSSMEEGWMGK
ncbi:hypothetical protein AVEN_214883-1, partial [Araneus ventricosus]